MNDEKNKKSNFVDHLTELRSRLLKSFIYLFIFFLICYFFAENIYSFLIAPYAEAVKDDDINNTVVAFVCAAAWPLYFFFGACMFLRRAIRRE